MNLIAQRKSAVAHGAEAVLVATALLCAVASGTGCGGDPAVATCVQGCDRTGACLGWTQGQIFDCKNMNCTAENANKPYVSCVNTKDILSCQSSCYSAPSCNTIIGCLFGCPKCVK